MTSWTDLLQALARQRPEVKAVPPALKYEDLWDLQRRIEALEAEVRHLSSVLVATLNRLNEAEETEE